VGAPALAGLNRALDRSAEFGIASFVFSVECRQTHHALRGDWMFQSKRDVAALREDLLCAFLVLRELHEYGQHYGEAARSEIVQKALTALRNAWADTGAEEDDIEPALLGLLASGKICRTRPRDAAE
jgi:hypothetical protein